MPKCPPPPVLMPPPLQSCQKVAKKLILSDEPGQTNFKKVPKWPVWWIQKSHQYRVKWKKWSKFPIFGHFWRKKGPIYLCKFDFCPKELILGMIWGKKLESSRQNDKKWEILTILSILILSYIDGFLSPPNLAICTFFKFCPDSSLKIRFFCNVLGIFGGRGFKTGGGTFWQIVLKYKKLTLKCHQYRIKNGQQFPFLVIFDGKKGPIYESKFDFWK